jgi:hypothetical protein
LRKKRRNKTQWKRNLIVSLKGMREIRFKCDIEQKTRKICQKTVSFFC